MAASFSDDLTGAVQSLVDYASSFARPTIRLGVTGLSRAGKTVFLTALVHNLVAEGRSKGSLPVFRALSEGRIVKARLEHQPDDTVPRFAYEDHLMALTGPDRHWPDGTRRISELRLVIEYQSKTGWLPGTSTLTLDIVDYPGEWLLDLALLDKSFEAWASETIAGARKPSRNEIAGPFLEVLGSVNPDAPFEEADARRLADALGAYLRACRDDQFSLSALPPGRFLMPGDLEGSPALTFAPLELPAGHAVISGSLAAAMVRRYEAYKREVVRPFFRDHFSRLDRQIVLVDALSALNAGPGALADLETALTGALSAFRPGENSLFSSIFAPRVGKVLFAATKADHLHHTSHDRLEGILRAVVGKALARARSSGAEIDVVALAAVRATREAEVKQGRVTVPCIVGVPLAGERLGDEVFDGEGEVAAFPGDLPADPMEALRATPDDGADARQNAFRALRFRPPKAQREPDGRLKPLPQIRLDRAVEFLIGDKLR
jgi:uncharacterized protein